MSENQAPIDRAAVVARHRVRIDAPDPEHVLSVGNGDFAFNADITGMQTFTRFHDPVVGQQQGRTVVNTTTMSSWGWHTMPNPSGYSLEDTMTTYETTRGPVSYPDKHDMMGAMTGQLADDHLPGAWLNANPQRLDLGRIGLELRRSADDIPETDPTSLETPHQELDLWSGMLTSEFGFDRQRTRVQTVSAPDSAVVAFRIVSDLLADGRAKVAFRFPYASDSFFATDDWSSEDAHSSDLETLADGSTRIARVLDDDRYVVDIAVSQDAAFHRTGSHSFAIQTTASAIDVVVRFAPIPVGAPLPSFDEIQISAAEAWPAFWSSGAALDLSGSADPRAIELERRLVLSQYLTRVHSAGTLPPAETGLVTNSWQGKFHLEMHLWHAAHFAVWGRPELLERSLAWYLTILDEARATATRQNYPGARWPKQTGPLGHESPSDIGSLLAWQQPHVLYMLDLVWRASSVQAREPLAKKYGELVEETAAFMAAFAEERDGTFHLGPPIMPAQEFYDPRATTDPTFELAYWWWGLEIAQRWRERRGTHREDDWTRVQDLLDAPFLQEGRYAAVASREPLRRDDHPSLLMAYGVVPPTPLIDPLAMRATFDDVWGDWEWPSAWGWDFPVLAMTAGRVGEHGRALDALLREEDKNRYTAVGHNPQMGSMLPLYLPGNGGTLLAVALLIQEGSFDAPGWSARHEGFVSFPEGSPFDPRRRRQETPGAVAERTERELSAESTIGDWLEHPVGHGILEALLTQMGRDAASLSPLRGLPLTQLVALSQGALPHSAIDALVDAVRTAAATRE